MMGIRRVFINSILVTSLAAGVAMAQDAPPPPPDSQYPANTDTQTGTPQFEQPNEPVYATPQSQTQDQGGYPQQGSQDQGGYSQNAPPPPPTAEQAQPSTSQEPASRVARMQYMQGQVSIQPGGVNDWVAATQNRPMTTGDNVWTDKDSRAELNDGTGVYQMGPETSLTLANIADNTSQLQLHQGTLELHVRHLYNGEVYEVDTPNMAFTIQKPGDYRFDVDPNNDKSFVTVWHGEGNATGDGPSVEVREGERAQFSNGTSMAYSIDKAPAYDQFDEWAMTRDHRIDNSESAKYVSPDVIGSSDLDDYGKWQQNPEYGNVWVPNDQGPDWQPYSDGNWIYQQPWGWSWVGYEPWGFAPYHYGRWVTGPWGWGWAPGPYAYWGAPYYAPALVGWFGGPGFGIGVGWGGFGFGFGGGWGWCALGWGEPFLPWYHVGWGYFHGINRWGGVRNIGGYWHGGAYGRFGYGDHFHFANAQRGLVATNGRTIMNGAAVRANRVSLNASQRAQFMNHPANMSSMRSSLRPTTQGMIGARAASRAAAVPPARAVSRATVAHMTPPSRGAAAPNRGAMAARGMNNARPSAGLNNARPGAENRGGTMAHNVPRPSTANGAARGNAAASNHYVPRPPSAGGTIGNRAESHMPSAVARNGNAARPGGSGYSRPGSSYSAPRNNVPRPSGSAYGGRSYAAPSYGGRGYASPSYGRTAPSYSARSYGNPYGGGAPHYSAPHYSAPHYSAPSGGHAAPAYHGGGGGFHGGGGGGFHGGGGGGHSGGGGSHGGGGRH